MDDPESGLKFVVCVDGTQWVALTTARRGVHTTRDRSCAYRCGEKQALQIARNVRALGLKATIEEAT
ncbi:MAG: hypothetical protein AB7F78_03185 [Hyphomicrobiaceae bacterium]